MQSEEYVAAALRALAEQDAGREAPEEVEMRLRQVFRHRRARRKWKAVVLASLAAAAALTIVFLAGPRGRPKPAAPSPAPRELVAERTVQVEVAAPAAPTPVHSRPKPRPAVRPLPAQPREVVTEFFPLLDVAPPFERGELLRVMVPAATMRRVGLPVNQERLGDRVYADVLVGQEGLARAIRFVSYEQ